MNKILMVLATTLVGSIGASLAQVGTMSCETDDPVCSITIRSGSFSSTFDSPPDELTVTTILRAVRLLNLRATESALSDIAELQAAALQATPAPGGDTLRERDGVGSELFDLPTGTLGGPETTTDLFSELWAMLTCSVNFSKANQQCFDDCKAMCSTEGNDGIESVSYDDKRSCGTSGTCQCECRESKKEEGEGEGEGEQ